MGRVVAIGCLLVALGLSTAGPALALSCPNVPVTQRVDELDAAFIGTMQTERPDPDVPGGYLYRFAVIEALKGQETLGPQVDVRAPARLVSSNDEPLVGYEDVEVGVMLSTAGAT
ncbi:MAG: hypothetical protein OEV72_07060, partial [Thermoleophilia bacterium]|nr:hypothetical protein [Thermoleophilia bacterium]